MGNEKKEIISNMGKIIIIYKTPISQKEIIQTLFSSWENIFLQSMFAGFFLGGGVL